MANNDKINRSIAYLLDSIFEFWALPYQIENYTVKKTGNTVTLTYSGQKPTVVIKITVNLAAQTIMSYSVKFS